MSLMDKFLNSVKLVDDEDYEDELEEYEEEDYEEEEEEKRGFFGFGRKKKAEEENEDEQPSKLTAMRGGKSSQKMKVCVIKPSSYEEVREIADTLLSNCTIILNMEGIDLSLAQRIIDFMTGACYAIDGNLQMISNYIFIITPAAVGISGDLKGVVDALESTRMASGGGFASF